MSRGMLEFLVARRHDGFQAADRARRVRDLHFARRDDGFQVGFARAQQLHLRLRLRRLAVEALQSLQRSGIPLRTAVLPPLLDQPVARRLRRRRAREDVALLAVRDQIPRRHAGDVHEGPVLGQLQPEVPVLEQVEVLVETRRRPRQGAAEHHAMDGQVVFEQQPDRVEAGVEAVHGLPVAALQSPLCHVGKRGRGLGPCPQRGGEPAHVIRQQQVVVVQEQQQLACCRGQPAVGGLGTQQRLAVGRCDGDHRQTAAALRQRAVPLPERIHDHQFDRPVGLQHH